MRVLMNITNIAFAAGMLASGVGGCGGDGLHPDGLDAFRALDEKEPARVAARVDGEVLGLEEFQSYWDEHPDLSRDEVVERVVQREVAARRALVAGKRLVERLGHSRKKAMVRVLLRDRVEARVGPDDLDEKTLQNYHDRLAASVGRPAGMSASHLLVMVPQTDSEDYDVSEERRGELLERARRWSGRIREDILTDQVSANNSAEPLFLAMERYDSRIEEPLDVLVNAHLSFRVPEASDDSSKPPPGWVNVVEPFAEAASEMAREGRFGELSDPVRSEYGWHLIVAHERLPAKVPQRDALREVAVSRLLQLRRNEVLTERFREWKRNVSLTTFPGVIEEQRADK